MEFPGTSKSISMAPRLKIRAIMNPAGPSRNNSASGQLNGNTNRTNPTVNSSAGSGPTRGTDRCSYCYTPLLEDRVTSIYMNEKNMSIQDVLHFIFGLKGDNDSDNLLGKTPNPQVSLKNQMKFPLCLNCSRCLKELYKNFKRFVALSNPESSIVKIFESGIVSTKVFNRPVGNPETGQRTAAEILEEEDDEINEVTVITEIKDGSAAKQMNRSPVAKQSNRSSVVKKINRSPAVDASNAGPAVTVRKESPAVKARNEDPAVKARNGGPALYAGNEGPAVKESNKRPAVNESNEVSAVNERNEIGGCYSCNGSGCNICGNKLIKGPSPKQRNKRSKGNDNSNCMCSICKKMFRTKYDVKRHADTVHKKTKTNAKAPQKKNKKKEHEGGEILEASPISSENNIVSEGTRPKRAAAAKRGKYTFSSDEEDPEDTYAPILHKEVNRIAEHAAAPPRLELYGVEDVDGQTLNEEDSNEISPVNGIMNNELPNQAEMRINPKSILKKAKEKPVKVNKEAQKTIKKQPVTPKLNKSGLPKIPIYSNASKPKNDSKKKKEKKYKRGDESDSDNDFNLHLGDDDESLAARDRERRNRNAAKYTFDDDNSDSDI